MPTLTIYRGVSGSGKSTEARQQNAVVVSRDAIRLAFFGSDNQDYYQVPKTELSEKENTVTVLSHAAIGGALKAGKDVISDDTNIEWKYVKAIAKIGYRYGADVQVKVFDVSYDTALNRNGARAKSGGRSVPAEVIRKQYDRFKQTKNLELPVVNYPKPYSGTPGKPAAFMFDLDGTTYHMNDKRRPYAENVDVDDPDETVQEIINAITTVTGWIPIAMSGRKEATRALTEHCLKRDYVMYDHLFMRADDDNRADNLVKADLFDEHIRNNFNVQFVLDDRDQVVEMWRRLGLKCLQVAEGNF